MKERPLSPAVLQHRQALLEAAVQGNQRSDARHSHFSVGAAVLTEQGEIFIGCNWESLMLDCLGKTHHSEQSALSTMLAYRGPQKVIALALAGGDLKARIPCTPCGNCREHLSTYAAADTPIFLVAAGCEVLGVHRLGDLLPSRSGLYTTEAHGPIHAVTPSETKVFDHLKVLVAKAYVPYSHAPVAVAVETWDHHFFYGVTREDAAYSGTSATYNALSAMVLEKGPDVFVKRVYYGPHPSGKDYIVMPSGPDRQALREHARATDRLTVLSWVERGSVRHTLADLLPHDFGPQNLHPVT